MAKPRTLAKTTKFGHAVLVQYRRDSRGQATKQFWACIGEVCIADGPYMVLTDSQKASPEAFLAEVMRRLEGVSDAALGEFLKRRQRDTAPS